MSRHRSKSVQSIKSHYGAKQSNAYIHYASSTSTRFISPCESSPIVSRWCHSKVSSDRTRSWLRCQTFSIRPKGVFPSYYSSA